MMDHKRVQRGQKILLGYFPLYLSHIPRLNKWERLQIGKYHSHFGERKKVGALLGITFFGFPKQSYFRKNTTLAFYCEKSAELYEDQQLTKPGSNCLV